MKWFELKEVGQLGELKELSHKSPVLVFKHSTRCSISAMALNRLERSWNAEEVPEVKPFYLDLIQNREVSNALAEEFSVAHQSPQLLLICDGKCVYHTSHMGISYRDFLDQLGTLFAKS